MMGEAANPKWLTIVGIGEDGVEGLSSAARRAIETAVLVVGGTRHLALAADAIRGERLAWPSPLTDAVPKILRRRGEAVTVLASGDPYCYGIGGTLSRYVPLAETACFPAPSAFALACARLGWSAQDVTCLSASGRPIAGVLPALQPGRRLLVLSADATTPGALAALLREHGFGPSLLHILEALGGPHERVRNCSADIGPPPAINPLNLVGIEVIATAAARIIPRAPGLPERLFEHDGQITKHEVRAVTLAALAPQAGQMLWDIGCGSGSVCIEWLLAHEANRACGVEQREDRAERARRNALRLGVPALQMVTGTAPAALAGLPAPDAIFIGGGAQAPHLIDTAWNALRPNGRLVANAVTIETEILLFAAQQKHGGTLTRLAVERLDPVGRSHGFRPAMPVTQWAAVKR